MFLGLPFLSPSLSLPSAPPCPLLGVPPPCLSLPRPLLLASPACRHEQNVALSRRGELLCLRIWCIGLDSCPRSVKGGVWCSGTRALYGSISPHGLGQSKHMKTNSFVAPTGSASSPAIMLECSCFHRICEFLIMWEQRSERRRHPARVAHRSQPSSSCLEHSDTRWSGGLCRQQ